MRRVAKKQILTFLSQTSHYRQQRLASAGFSHLIAHISSVTLFCADMYSGDFYWKGGLLVKEFGSCV